MGLAARGCSRVGLRIGLLPPDQQAPNDEVGPIESDSPYDVFSPYLHNVPANRPATSPTAPDPDRITRAHCSEALHTFRPRRGVRFLGARRQQPASPHRLSSDAGHSARRIGAGPRHRRHGPVAALCAERRPPRVRRPVPPVLHHRVSDRRGSHCRERRWRRIDLFDRVHRLECGLFNDLRCYGFGVIDDLGGNGRHLLDDLNRRRARIIGFAPTLNHVATSAPRSGRPESGSVCASPRVGFVRLSMVRAASRRPRLASV